VQKIAYFTIINSNIMPETLIYNPIAFYAEVYIIKYSQLVKGELSPVMFLLNYLGVCLND